jgi:hypothetical protein
MKICECILFYKVQLFLWQVPLKEENIVNCGQRENTNFDVKIKKFVRAHCKNEI